ncbi:MULTISPECIES: hypothetical protein [unclassified Rathayibacter]|uniref:hypothetical protein n=1 Tax=unclassified Rathayibacter TaxID=2609250 RepID=UPI0006F63685|nr:MULTISPECIES: hypothetical protein [unclassified Rathayibacter]KQQ04125.1 hypothetical protein ASF42_12005 [Rathayibacter sp. Leaf294]KQS12579.1 hypothetical protein ASG06_12005 [Rathayibacter sp. Leaf185]
MSSSPDGAPGRRAAPARTAGAAPSRRAARTAAPATRTAGRRPSRAASVASGARATAGWRRYGPALASIAIALITVPISFFVWYALISLGAFPGDQAVSDLLVGVLYTAIVHALLLAGVLLGVSSIRARRREGRPAVAGWIGVVLNVLVVVYWELLVSPWLVELWNRATAS